MNCSQFAGSAIKAIPNQAMSGVSHYDHLDFLRASAVMLVFFSHLVGTLAGTRATGLGSAAHFGVLMFFVHTSLVLFMSLDRRQTRSIFLAFYVRRAFRIYPLAMVTVVLVLCLGLPPAPWITAFQPTFSDVLSNLMLVQNVTRNRDILATMWSLPFEVQMYLALPALFLLRNKFHAVAVWCAVAIMAEVLRLAPAPLGELLRYTPCFAAGLVAYALLRGFQPRRVRFLLMPLILAGGVMAFVAVSHFTGESAITDWLAALGIGTLTGLMNGEVPLALSNICAVIAKYSYGIYLSHLPLMIVCFGAGFSSVRLLSFSVLTVVVPIVLFHAIEQPMIVLGNKLANLLRQPLDRPSALIASVSE